MWSTQEPAGRTRSDSKAEFQSNKHGRTTTSTRSSQIQVRREGTKMRNTPPPLLLHTRVIHTHAIITIASLHRCIPTEKMSEKQIRDHLSVGEGGGVAASGQRRPAGFCTEGLMSWKWNRDSSKCCTESGHRQEGSVQESGACR